MDSQYLLKFWNYSIILFFIEFTEFKMVGKLTDVSLTHFNAMFHFYTPENVRENKPSGGIEIEHYVKMDSTV